MVPNSSSQQQANTPQKRQERNLSVEELLGQSGRQLIETLDNFYDGIFALNKDWDFVYLNKTAASIINLKPEDILGKNIWISFPQVNKTELGDTYRSAMKEQKIKHLETQSVNKKYWFDLTAYPSKDGLIVQWRDITERKKAEEELLHVASFPTLNPNPIIEADFNGKITYANPIAKKNLNNIEALGSAHPFLSKWQDVVKSFEQKTTAILTREVKVDSVWYLQVLYLVPNSKYIRIYSIDISERKKAEEAVQRQADLIDLSPDAIIVRKVDGTITFWSRGAEKMYGWSKAEAIGQNTHQLFETKFPIPFEQVITELRQTKRWSGELIHRTKSGEKVVVQSWWSASLEQNGVIGELLESNVDITKLKEIENSLRQRTEQLQATQEKLEDNATILEEYANQMEQLAEQRATELRSAERLAAIGQTAGMVGHDIRNPLQAITSDLYLIEQAVITKPDCNNEDIAESLNSINDNIDYINKIVSDLQDYTKPAKPTMSTINLRTLIAKAVERRKIPPEIKMQVSVAGDYSIRTDETYFKRIIGNLVGNAIQAMPNGGILTINANQQGNDAVIIVQDTGVGISEKDKPNLFKPLFTTKAKGQGLGLAVVKRFVEALQGSISFESEEGKGTKFIVKLPLTPNDR